MAEPPGLEKAEHTGTDSLAVEGEEDWLVVGSFELWESVEDEEDWLVVDSYSFEL